MCIKQSQQQQSSAGNDSLLNTRECRVFFKQAHLHVHSSLTTKGFARKGITFTHTHAQAHRCVGGLWAVGNYRANRIISVCSGRWQGISLQVNETVTVIGLHLSSHTELRTVRVRERDYWRDSDENWSQDNESGCLFILSSCMCVRARLSLSLIIQSDWLESSFTVCCLLKNPERL